MKKTFQLKGSKHKPNNLADSIKHEVKKYIARERGKKLPIDVDFWDFSCRIGVTEDDSERVHEKELNPKISEYFSEEVETIYIEILAKPGKRASKSK